MECETKEGGVTVTLVAKWGKERITLDELPPATTIAEVKLMLSEQTRILPKRQKLIGLSSGSGKVTDDLPLKDLTAKGSASKNRTMTPSANAIFSFILMGTPEEHIFVDPHEKDDLPDVIDDFDLDFNAGSHEVRSAFSSVRQGLWFERKKYCNRVQLQS
jgi:ubiquitin-like domain-containing CTD phosphatase 1